MLSLVATIIQFGVKEDKPLWQNQLVSKLNKMSLMGIVNMTLGSFFFYFSGFKEFVPECIASILVFLLILYTNRHFSFFWGLYAFYTMGFLFLTMFSLKMGKGSYMILFFFPVIISLVQLLGRKETMRHLIILSVLCISAISVIAANYYFNWFFVEASEKDQGLLSLFNIILSSITTLFFTIVVVQDFISQERIIKEMLDDKNVLLAEVFHRVKNNLNVVTSLLNLQKNNSNSTEVQNALEECRSRIFSMALVHENLFNDKEIGLDFKKYIDRLVRDIELTFGVNGQTEIDLHTENVVIELEKALPCGMILNELITNAHKYARTDKDSLKITISLKKVGDKIELTVRDNGPGIEQEKLTQINSLGFVLIDSLCDQLGGDCTKTNDDGFVYKMIF